jgi:hypothetical protein
MNSTTEHEDTDCADSSLPAMNAPRQGFVGARSGERIHSLVPSSPSSLVLVCVEIGVHEELYL